VSGSEPIGPSEVSNLGVVGVCVWLSAQNVDLRAAVEVRAWVGAREQKEPKVSERK
jgi:hypothetical protein